MRLRNVNAPHVERWKKLRKRPRFDSFPLLPRYDPSSISHADVQEILTNLDYSNLIIGKAF